MGDAITCAAQKSPGRGLPYARLCRSIVAVGVMAGCGVKRGPLNRSWGRNIVVVSVTADRGSKLERTVIP